MGVMLGLLAALGWGAGDFLISRVSRSVGVLQTMLYIQLTGIAAIGLVLLARGAAPPADAGAWLLGFGVNLFNLAGTLLLYRAFAVGSLAVVSPIAAGFAVVTAALAMADGERLGQLALLGTGLVIGGVVVVSRGQGRGATSLRGVPEALGAALLLGVFFWLIGRVTPQLGIAWPVLVGRVSAVAVALLAIMWRGAPPAALPARLWPTVVAATAFDTTAFLAYNSGVSGAYVSVVSALASIFSAVTVLLAWVVLRERLARVQWAGVAAILVGVLLVSV